MRARRVFTLPPVYWRRHTGPLPARYAMAAEMRRATHHNHLLHKLMRERVEALEKVKDLECEIAIRTLGARARIERADAAERQLAEAREKIKDLESRLFLRSTSHHARIAAAERRAAETRAVLRRLYDSVTTDDEPAMSAAAIEARALLAETT